MGMTEEENQRVSELIAGLAEHSDEEVKNGILAVAVPALGYALSTLPNHELTSLLSEALHYVESRKKMRHPATLQYYEPGKKALGLIRNLAENPPPVHPDDVKLP